MQHQQANNVSQTKTLSLASSLVITASPGEFDDGEFTCLKPTAADEIEYLICKEGGDEQSRYFFRFILPYFYR